MSYKNISAELSDENLTLAIQKVREIEELFPFIINLSTEEIKRLPKMGDKSVPFVEKSIEFADQVPQCIPQYLDVGELKKDLVLSKKLKTFINVLDPFVEKIKDTYYATGGEAFTAARVIYRGVKNAAESDINIPGIDAINTELGKRYKYYRSKGEESEEKSKASNNSAKK